MRTLAKGLEEFIGTCEICGREIYEGDKHYELPDGFLVCDDDLCMEEWLLDYERH